LKHIKQDGQTPKNDRNVVERDMNKIDTHSDYQVREHLLKLAGDLPYLANAKATPIGAVLADRTLGSRTPRGAA